MRGSDLTELQRASIVRCYRAGQEGRWHRSTYAGERVTLASLHTRGLLERRAWRGAEGRADSAFEYRCTPALQAKLAEVFAR